MKIFQRQNAQCTNTKADSRAALSTKAIEHLHTALKAVKLSMFPSSLNTAFSRFPPQFTEILCTPEKVSYKIFFSKFCF